MSSGRVLVVDDEPQLRRVMRTALVANGYEAYEARTGEEALATLRENNLDLVLLDMNMPGIGGMAACRAIRAQSEVEEPTFTMRDGAPARSAASSASVRTSGAR